MVLGIALSDTYTSAVFFKNLSRKQAKLFDGVRQDSGDEFKFVTSAIARYKELGPDVVGKITGRRFKSRFKRLVSPIIVPREMYD